MFGRPWALTWYSGQRYKLECHRRRAYNVTVDGAIVDPGTPRTYARYGDAVYLTIPRTLESVSRPVNGQLVTSLGAPSPVLRPGSPLAVI